MTVALGCRNGESFDALVSFHDREYARRALLGLYGKDLAASMMFATKDIQLAYESQLNSLSSKATSTSKPSQTRAGQPDVWTLFVANIPNEADTAMLKAIFGKFGDIEKVYFRQQATGAVKIAYICFSSLASLKQARDQMQDYKMKGRTLKVAFHKGEFHDQADHVKKLHT
jgi:RNA recognition motif-containing protein